MVKWSNISHHQFQTHDIYSNNITIFPYTLHHYHEYNMSCYMRVHVKYIGIHRLIHMHSYQNASNPDVKTFHTRTLCTKNTLAYIILLYRVQHHLQTMFLIPLVSEERRRHWPNHLFYSRGRTCFKVALPANAFRVNAS